MSKSVYYTGRVYFILICFCCFSVQHVFAQLPVIKSSVNKDNILIGQQINYRVETTMPDNTFRLTWFAVPDSFGTFVVVSKNKIDSSVKNGNLVFSQELTLTNFDSGRQIIPPLKLTASTLDQDSTFNIYTDTIPINVSYAPLDSIQPFHDIKTIIEVKNPWPWWVWALIALGILLLTGLIIFLIKQFKKKRETTSFFKSNLSPYEEAMQSLTELEKEKLTDNNKVKEFHTRLTEIFKRYLSRKTDTYKLHLTTDEILIELYELDLPKNEIAIFANCLRMGNAVKFAQYIPPTYENEKCFSEVKNMIISINNQTTKKAESDL